MSGIRGLLTMTAVLAVAGAVLVACPKKQELPPMLPQDADAKALWNYITRSDPYTSWKTWPGKETFHQGTEPHGPLLTTYLNDTAYYAVKAQSIVLPASSIIVMESYTQDKALDAVAVMQKIPGYNSGAGDWFWAGYGPRGEVMDGGKVESCIDCHSAAKLKDYVMSERKGE